MNRKSLHKTVEEAGIGNGSLGHGNSMAILSASPFVADDDRCADVMRNAVSVGHGALGPVQVRVHLLAPVSVR